MPNSAIPQYCVTPGKSPFSKRNLTKAQVDFAQAVTGVPDSDPLQSLSDGFSGSALDSEWQVHNPGFLLVSVSGGYLNVSLT